MPGTNLKTQPSPQTANRAKYNCAPLFPERGSTFGMKPESELAEISEQTLLRTAGSCCSSFHVMATVRGTFLPGTNPWLMCYSPEELCWEQSALQKKMGASFLSTVQVHLIQHLLLIRDKSKWLQWPRLVPIHLHNTVCSPPKRSSAPKHFPIKPDYMCLSCVMAIKYRTMKSPRQHLAWFI